MIAEEIAAVVIGRNEGQRLVKCLKSVLSKVRCTVYVDSGSTDGSSQTAARLGAHVVALDMAKPFTAARARNEGFAAVKALSPDITFIQFIDGDCELVDGWLDKAAEFLAQRNEIAVVYGRRRELYPLASVYNALCDIEWDTSIGEAVACGGDTLVRTEAFETVGGFRPQLIAGEEPDLCLRLRQKKWKIWRLPAEMTRHDAAMKRFSQWWLRTVRFGYGMTEVALLHWRSSFPIWKRELARAFFWSGLAPAFIVLIAFIYPVMLAAMLIYPLQICRIAFARGPTSSHSWTYAFFMTLGKFAELQGIFEFCWRRCLRRPIEIIEYK